MLRLATLVIGKKKEKMIMNYKAGQNTNQIIWSLIFILSIINPSYTILTS